MESSSTNVNFVDLIEFSPIGILLFDKNWQIIYINNNFQRFGVTSRIDKKNLINNSILSSDLFDNFSILENIKNLTKNIPFEMELSSTSKSDGSLLNILLKGSPILEHNKFNGGVLIIDDVTVKNIPKSNVDEKISLIEDIAEKLKTSWVITDYSGKLIFTSSDISKQKSTNENYIFDLFLPDCKVDLENCFINLPKQNKKSSFHLKSLISKDQRIFNIAVLDLNNLYYGNSIVLFIFNDITNQRVEQQEIELKLSELKKCSEITNYLADSILVLDLQGNIISILKNKLKFFFNQEYQFIDKFIGELFPIITNEYFSVLLNDLQKNKYWTCQLRFNTITGDNVVLDTKVILYEEGQTKNIIFICSDFTEGYELERELKTSEEHYRSIVTNSKEFICTFDLDGKIRYVNPNFSEVFKISFSDAALLNITDLVDRSEISIENFDFDYIKSNDITNLELPLKKMDGGEIIVSANFTPVYDLSNSPSYYIGIFSDITKQKDSEKDLLLIKTVFEASKDGIAVESNNTLQMVNESFVEIFGYNSKQEMVGINPVELIEKSSRKSFINFLEDVIYNEVSTNRFEITGIKKTGETILCEFSIGNYKIGKSYFIVMLVRDITIEKEYQNALQISEERYRSITENINEFIWVAERNEGKLTTVLYTAAAHKITSYCADEFLNNPKLWYKIIHPNDTQLVISKLKKLYRDPVRLADEIEYRIINNVGDIIWIKNKITVVRDKIGEIVKLFGLVSDISLSKKNEEELKESADNLKKLNDTKDRFLSIISHDLRTPFTSILGFTDILLSNRNMEEEKQTQYISFIKESSTSMLSLVNSLLDWTRIQTGRIDFVPERLNAKNLVNKSVQTSIGIALQKGINVEIKVEKDIHVHGDENLLFQVFNNLISNAVKFCKKDDTITVSAKKLIDKKQIQFSIKDTGTGIKKEDQEKLFRIETKFTLQGTSGEKGSGLGLSLVSDIVKKHGGEIWVESEYGKGSDFIFTCPVSSTNILLVDDINTDRLLYSKLLKSVLPDYTIIEAGNGKEAFDLLTQMQPALIISDHTMPEMGGIELVKKINSSKLKFKPPVIILSSDLTTQAIDEYKELGIEFVFYKPVNLKVFKMSIEKSLKKAVLN